MVLPYKTHVPTSNFVSYTPSNHVSDRCTYSKDTNSMAVRNQSLDTDGLFIPLHYVHHLFVFSSSSVLFCVDQSFDYEPQDFMTLLLSIVMLVPQVLWHTYLTSESSFRTYGWQASSV